MYLLKVGIADLPRTDVRQKRRANGGGIIPFAKKMMPFVGNMVSKYAPEYGDLLEGVDTAINSFKSVD